MAQMLILADDLTGAADCGVACVGHGLHTIVALGDSGTKVSADVLSVDGDTRRLAPNEAATETARLLKHYLFQEDMLFYKKLDSTLRGNVGEELAATLAVRRKSSDSTERIVVVLAPAFPAAGRTTSGGKQHIFGKLLEDYLPLRDDPLHAPSDIAAMLLAFCLYPEVLALELIRGDSRALRKAMKTIAQNADVLVCDAETEDDLRKVAEASMVLGRRTVWAGSAGLARHMPLAAGLSRVSVTQPPRPLVVGSSLFVVGSGSDVSREQVEVLASKSDAIVIRIPSEVLIHVEQSKQHRTYELGIERALNAGSNVAVFPDSAGPLGAASGPLITAALAALVLPFADKVGALVVTGGETARAVLQAWGITRMQLICEVEAGLPFCVTSGWSRELPVITKAGGFGRPESLLHCLEFLRALDRGVTIRKGLK